jgi:hypothetical protein
MSLHIFASCYTDNPFECRTPHWLGYWTERDSWLETLS